MKRIIILASERSGTNLLRVLLGNHREISAPVAPHFFNNFKRVVGHYGDLNESKNAEKLLDHFIQTANHPFSDWKLQLDVAQAVKNEALNSLEKVFDSVYRNYAKLEGNNSYVVKDNDMFDHVELTERLNGDNSVYYIHLYRDPRDHAASWLKTPLFLHSTYDIAVKWDAEQSKIRQCGKKVSVYRVSYESLIGNPESTMTGILEHLGLPVDPNCFGTNVDNEESKRNVFWKNLSKPIIKDNKKKYLDTIPKNELKILETICKDNMLDLGYELDSKANWKDYFGIYKKKKLPKIRKKSRLENKAFYEKKMQDLKSKRELMKKLRTEVDPEAQ